MGQVDASLNSEVPARGSVFFIFMLKPNSLEPRRLLPETTVDIKTAVDLRVPRHFASGTFEQQLYRDGIIAEIAVIGSRGSRRAQIGGGAETPVCRLEN